MRFEFDYKYAISYIGFRKVNPSSSPALGRISIDIREVDLVDAPLVARIGAGEFRDTVSDKPSYSRKSNGDMRELRYIDGRFFIEVQSVEETRLGLETGTKNTPFQKHGTELIENDPRRLGAGDPYKTLSQVELENERCRELKDNKAETEEKFHNFARRFVVMEGILFQETPEPIADHSYGSPSVKPAYQTSYYQSYESNLEYSWDHFSSTKWADNLVDALERFEKAGETPPYEILDPRPFLFDGVSHAVFGRAEALVQAMHSAVWRMGDDYIDAYYDLKEAVDRSPNRCVTTDIIEALHKVATCDVSVSEKMSNELMGFREFSANENRHSADNFFPDERFDWSSDQFKSFGASATGALKYWETRDADRYWPDVGSMPEGTRTGNGDEGVISELNSVGKIAMAFYDTGVDVIDLQNRIQEGCRYFAVKTRRSAGVVEMDPDGAMRSFGDFSEEQISALSLNTDNNLKAALS